MIFQNKPFFIAEVSSNHQNDLKRCLKFIDIASDIGCDAVKFQLFKIEQLFVPEVLERSAEHRKRKNWELDTSFLPTLHERAKQKGIYLSFTPFYLDAVRELIPYVDFFKIASYELLWNDLIIECAASQLPLIMSTGMANEQEVLEAVLTARNNGCTDLSLLHCISAYPTPFSECNLSVISTIREKFNCRSGWSDHSVNPFVISHAISKWDAQIIEFHLDIEGEGAEYQGGHCWLPSEISKLIDASKNISKIDGNSMIEPSVLEEVERTWRADPSDGLRPLINTRKSL